MISGLKEYKKENERGKHQLQGRLLFTAMRCIRNEDDIPDCERAEKRKD